MFGSVTVFRQFYGVWNFYYIEIGMYIKASTLSPSFILFLWHLTFKLLARKSHLPDREEHTCYGGLIKATVKLVGKSFLGLLTHRGLKEN